MMTRLKREITCWGDVAALITFLIVAVAGVAHASVLWVLLAAGALTFSSRQDWGIHIAKAADVDYRIVIWPA
jgi:hypothetical protein